MFKNDPVYEGFQFDEKGIPTHNKAGEPVNKVNSFPLSFLIDFDKNLETRGKTDKRLGKAKENSRGVFG